MCETPLLCAHHIKHRTQHATLSLARAYVSRSTTPRNLPHNLQSEIRDYGLPTNYRHTLENDQPMRKFNAG